VKCEGLVSERLFVNMTLAGKGSYNSFFFFFLCRVWASNVILTKYTIKSSAHTLKHTHHRVYTSQAEPGQSPTPDISYPV
jgi:hypothetical protein